MKPCKIITISYNGATPTAETTSYHQSITEAKRQVEYNKMRAIREGRWQHFIIQER